MAKPSMKRLIPFLLVSLLLTGCAREDSINQAAINGLKSMGYREIHTQALIHVLCRPKDFGAANFEALDANNRYIVGTFCIHKIAKEGFHDTQPLSFTILTRPYD